MMRAKIFLLWLLALAIPVQGFAAVLQACAPAMSPATHHAAHAAMQEIRQDDTPAEMAHAHQHHAADDGASPQALTAAAPDTLHHPQHKSSCSYCAACTVGAILPLALAAPAGPDLPSREYLALAATGFVGYLPENPDRPPALA